jgi:tRNA A37 threonylcarbamoyladenosine synthetase subunit TsaC/SUA5/YrdC
MKTNHIENAYQVIKAGGLAIIPSRVGYTLLGNSEEAISKMFKLKNRPLTKPCVVLTNRKTLDELAEIPATAIKIIDEIDKQKLLCGFILPRKKHELYNSLSPWTSSYSQKGGTSCFVINAGEYINYLVEQSIKDKILIVGSSANQSGTGNEGIFSNIPDYIRRNVNFALEDDKFFGKEYNPKTREQGVMIEWLKSKPNILRRGIFISEIEKILQANL